MYLTAHVFLQKAASGALDDAYVSTINDLSKSGKEKTGGSVDELFSPLHKSFIL